MNLLVKSKKIRCRLVWQSMSQFVFFVICDGRWRVFGSRWFIIFSRGGMDLSRFIHPWLVKWFFCFFWFQRQIFVRKLVKNTPIWPKRSKCWFWAGAGAGLKLAQPVKLFRTSLLFQGHERHHIVTSFSHCIHLQFPSITWNNYGGLHPLFSV